MKSYWKRRGEEEHQKKLEEEALAVEKEKADSENLNNTNGEDGKI